MIKRFNRYEIKYAVSVATMGRILPELERSMEVDPHAAGHVTGYRVSSLYFDTPDLDCFRNKLDGLKYRRKLRIRRYPDQPDSPVFVEIKQRIDRTVQKRRVPMSLADAYSLCSGGRIRSSSAEDQAVLDEVHYLAQSLRLRPKNVITYTRRAFVGHFIDPGLRLTFDTMVRTRMADFDLEQDRPLQPAFPLGQAVMEVKANERIPFWLVNTLSRHQCSLSRISKYCYGMAQIKRRLESARVRA